MASPLPLLSFAPIIKPRPWGGRKLESLYSKVLPGALPCGESWEIADLPGDSSAVAGGPLAATTLADLVRTRPEELLGDASPLLGRFPVLFKLIDAREILSVQVHPDQESAERLGDGARPKTEAWYILQAEESAKLYLGLKEGVGREEFEAAAGAGAAGDLLLGVPARSGDFIYLPAGTLHAIGPGILLAEVQQASDTTYRVFDWNRAGLDNRPRRLHLAEALQSIRFEVRGKPPHAGPISGRPGIRCRWFTFERVGLGAGSEAPLEAGRPRIVFCVEGRGMVGGTATEPLALRPGDTCLIPACRAVGLGSESGGTFLLVRV